MSASPRAASATAEDRPAAESAQAPDPAATRPADPRTTTRLTVLLISGVALAGVSLVSLGQGSVTVSGGEVWTALFGSPQSVAAEATVGTTIVWTLRLPRLILGMLIGSSLALAGTVLQAILRNPLADPGIIGVSAGGGLVAVILLIVFPHMTGWLPLGATLGGLGVALLIYGIAWKDGTVFPLRVILAGVALNTALASLMSLLMLLYSERVPAVLPWLAGTLSGRSWPQVGLLWPYACAAGLPVFFCARQLNLLLLGEEQAAALGLPVTLTRLGLSALAAGLAAGVVSVAGLIGFVGLVVPHLCRLLVGADHRFLLPTAALVGAGLVVTADLSARTLFAPLEIPVGLLLALLGAPYFLWILRRGL